MISHRTALVTAYFVAGIYFGFVVVQDFDSILEGLMSFFDNGPAWYAYALTVAIVAGPLAFIVVAIMVYRSMNWPVVVLPAIYAVLSTSGFLAIALGAYLLLYFVIGLGAKTVPDGEV